MKKIISLTLMVMFMLTASTSMAQFDMLSGPVKKTKNAAIKLQTKVSNSNFKKFKKNYTKAVDEIEMAIKTYPNEEFGYDKLVEEIPAWIEMYAAIAKLPAEGVTDSKGNTFTYEVVDHSALLETAKVKAGEAHYNAALKLLENAADYSVVKDGFKHFDKAKEYVDTYNDKIPEHEATALYNEGVRIMNQTDASFNQKEKCLKFFDMAEERINPFKDIITLRAKLYFDEGVRLMASSDLKDITKAIEQLNKSGEFVANYNDYPTKIEEARTNAAEIIYQKAMAEESENNFKAQAKAAETYKEIREWVAEYKDAELRAKAAEKRAFINVMVVSSGKELKPGTHDYWVKGRCKKHVVNPKVGDDIAHLDLKDLKSFVKVTEKTGKYFVVIKKAETEPVGKYTVNKPTKSTKKRTVYTAQEKGKDEVSIGSILYNTMKKQKAEGAHKGTILRTYSGTLTTEKASCTYSMTVNVEIWDLRNPESPTLIATVPVVKTKTISKENNSYSGDPKAKPDRMSSQSMTLPTEDEMKSKVGFNTVTLSKLLREDKVRKDLAKKLDDIEYVRFGN
jgi:tetratricopeptide (TPR) repeat protein